MRIKINGKKYDFFDEVNLTLAYDAFSSTFGFKAYFDPTDEAHKALFRPLRYSKVEIEFNDEILLTGCKLSESFVSTASPQWATISGYSLTGALEDSSIPLSVYPLQSDGMTLKEITETILKPFDIALVVDKAVEKEANEVISQTDAKVGDSPKTYITQLATEKSILVTHTASGALLFTKAKASNRPIADLSDAPTKRLVSNGQGLHSSIAVLKEADLSGGNAGEEELDNPIIQSFRPKIVTQTSGDDNDTPRKAKEERAAELAGVKLTINLESWLVNGKVIKPNQVISVKDEKLFLYKRTNWFIESVELSGNVKEQVATLTCVLPETYNLNEPSNPFS